MRPSGAIILSPFCDNACIFCSSIEQLGTDALRRMDALARRNLEYHRAQGITRIEISGGDPGEYDDLPALIADMKQQGFEHVMLSTNGVRCADPAWAGALVDAGLDAVKIPLYGSTAAVHEQVARKPGCFDAAILALSHFYKLGVPIMINTVIVSQNHTDLIALHRLMLTFCSWRKCVFSIPCLTDDAREFYIPIKDLAFDCVPLIYAGVMNETPPVFSELPKCVFGFDYPFINRGGPPSQGLQQPPAPYRSAVKDVPTYRLKTYPVMCEACYKRDECDGFFANDLAGYGIGDLKPFAAN